MVHSWYSFVWCDIVWYVIWYAVVHIMVLHDTVWYGDTWLGRVWYDLLNPTNLLQYQKFLVRCGDRSFHFESLLVDCEIKTNLWFCEELMFHNDSSFEDWQPDSDLVMHV
jgi:hypothetical protein